MGDKIGRRSILDRVSRLLGTVSWSPPPWWSRFRERLPTLSLRDAVRARLAAITAWIHSHPRQLRIVAIATACVAVLAGGSYLWLKFAPTQALVSVHGSTPDATKLEDGARPDPVTITFGGSVARLDQVDKVVAQGVRITPPITGEWRWQGDSRLVFTPKEDWGVAQSYVVEFDRELFPNHVKLKRYDHRFTSASFQVSLGDVEFHQDPKNPKIKKVIATLKFTHPVDSVDLEKRISMRLAGQKTGLFGIGGESYRYTVSYNKFKGEAYLHSAPVAIPEKDTHMILAIDSGVRSERGGKPSDDKFERRIPIPGMHNYFRIQSANLALVRNERYEPEQVLVIQTTDGVEEGGLEKTLQAYLLPRDLPAIQDRPAKRNIRYWNVREIGPEVLALATKVDLKPLPTDRQYATLHSFRYQSEPGRTLYLRIGKGLQSGGGYILARDFDAALTVPEFPKELNIMYDGAILSLAGEKKVSVVARDIEGVRFEIGRVLPGQLNHLITQTSGHFRNPDFSNWKFGIENISERFHETRDLKRAGHGKSQYAAFDLTPYLTPAGGPRRGLFFFRVESWNPKTKSTTGIQDNRLLLVTDLGLVVKDNIDGSHEVFVQSISRGTPVAGVRVEVLGKNGLPVVTVTTNVDGHATLPKLSDFRHEKEPVVYLARHGEDLSFLPYRRDDRRLNFSRFDIGGEHTTGSGDRLSAYLFSDRGIYRPGDTIHVGLIVKPQDWRQLLAGVPIETVVTDARGLEVQRRKLSLSASGLEDIRYTTQDNSPTGNYQVAAYIVRDNRRAVMLGSTTVRVEEFLPDRMKISTRLSKERREGWVSPDELKGLVSLKNLFGTAAAGRRIAAQITLTPFYPSFRAHPDYRFFDPLRTKNRFTERLPDQKTSDQGEAEFALDLKRFDNATYQLSFLAEGFEAEGGRSVVSESTVLVSPLKQLVGYKADGELGYISHGSNRSIHLIAINPELKKVPLTKLTAQIVELRYVSVLTQQSNGAYKYESVRKEMPGGKQALAIPAQGLTYPLPTRKPGDYALVVRGPDDTELNRIEFSVVGQANLTRSLEKNAELQVKLAKTDFAPGETIELQITAPYTGSGLITIERERVYAHQWFRTTTTNSVQRIRVPAGLEGNGYVNVTFVRAMDSPEIFMSPLSYAVVPFSVSREKRTNPIQLEHPELVRPGELFKIRYRSKHPGRIIVFAVDEGILQVARYQTPDPLAHFFRKRALEVQTAQILDLILPEFKLIQALSAPGGDAEAQAAIGKNLNPFKRRRDKPVIYWSGILTSDQTAREVSYRVPDYFNGSLRVMAVAVSADSIGVAKQQATVRGHFVLSPNTPTTVGPNDEFEVSVGIANNLEGSGREPVLNLRVETSKHLQVLDSPSQSLKIAEFREGVARYRVRARDILGSGSITFTVSHGGKQARHTVDLSIRPPMPYVTTLSTGHFKSGRVDVPVPRNMYPHFRELKASASPVPLALAHGLVTYLDKFPYGCTEQIVSQAFPAIVLRARPEFGYAPDRVEANLERVIAILRARQNADGAFGFWAANSHVSDIQTVYAIHFLTEAKERNYPVPPDMLAKSIGYLRSLATRESESLSQARVRAYAIYLLTRNGIVSSNWLNSLRTHLDEKHTKLWRKDLTAAYMASSYQLLKQTSPANNLIDGMKLGEAQAPDYAYLYDGLVRDTQLLYLIARHFPEQMQKISGSDFMAIVKPLADGNFNTISSAYTILALDAFAQNTALTEAARIEISEILASNQVRALLVPKGLFARVDFTPDARKLRIASPSDFTVFYQVTQAGFDSAPAAAEIKRKLEIQREYRDANGRVVKQVPLGSELTVHIKVRTVGDLTLQNVAIVDLLPGGFEVVLDSIPRQRPGDLDTTPDSVWRAEHVDAREDRVLMFGTIGPNVQEYTYRIKATNKGRYTIPPVFAESMYDRTVQARGLGDTMVVDGP